MVNRPFKYSVLNCTVLSVLRLLYFTRSLQDTVSESPHCRSRVNVTANWLKYILYKSVTNSKYNGGRHRALLRCVTKIDWYRFKGVTSVIAPFCNTAECFEKFSIQLATGGGHTIGRLPWNIKIRGIPGVLKERRDVTARWWVIRGYNRSRTEVQAVQYFPIHGRRLGKKIVASSDCGPCASAIH